MLKYITIQDDLIEKIKSGYFKEGDFLPTEQELCDTYHVSRITIRKALDILAKNNYIIKTKGQGSRVCHFPVSIKSPYLKSFTQEMKENHKEVSTEIISFNILSATNNIAHKLGIQEGSPIYYYERLRKADNIAMILSCTYMDKNLIDNFSLSDLEMGKFEFAQKCNMPIIYSNQIISAIDSDERISSLLEIPVNRPILKIKNFLYSKENQLFDYTELFLNPYHYELSIHKESFVDA